MQAVIIILTVIIAILLIIVVLVQKSKGGGLASNFAGSNQIMGVRRTNDFIEKTTWVLACAIAVLSIIAVLITPTNATNGSRVTMPAAPAETEAPDFTIPTGEPVMDLQATPAPAETASEPVEVVEVPVTENN